jgi:hypothetical protein
MEAAGSGPRGVARKNRVELLQCVTDQFCMQPRVEEFNLSIFHERVRDVRAMVVGDACGLPLHILHQSIEISARVGDADHPKGGTIPQAAGIEFGDRNVETGAQTVFQAAQHLAFVLERLRRFDVKLEGEKGDHAVVSGE